MLKARTQKPPTHSAGHFWETLYFSMWHKAIRHASADNLLMNEVLWIGLGDIVKPIVDNGL